MKGEPCHERDPLRRPAPRTRCANSSTQATPTGISNGKRPNIVMIMTDDVGWGDLGCYGGGPMRGAPTPHLDRLAAEGMRFANHYGQASCTAGRASFITSRIPIRTALALVLVPGDPDHLTPETPTVAQFLRDRGYITVQLGQMAARGCAGGVSHRQRNRRDVSHAPLLRRRLCLQRPESDSRLAGERPGVHGRLEQDEPRGVGGEDRPGTGQDPRFHLARPGHLRQRGPRHRDQMDPGPC